MSRSRRIKAERDAAGNDRLVRGRLTELWMASLAAGDGPLEEQLLRLMVYTGVSIRPAALPTNEHDPLVILQGGCGWCHQHARVLSFLARHLCGVDSRILSMRHADGNPDHGHTVCELQYGGAWHLFDPYTFGLSVYRDAAGHILSWEELAHHADLPALIAGHFQWMHDGGIGWFTPGLPPTICGYCEPAHYARRYLHGPSVPENGYADTHHR